MRAGAAAAQFGQQPGFKVGRNGMFQTLRFVVHAIPLHAKHFSEHAFDEVMAKGKLACDLASGSGQPDVAVALHTYQSHLSSRRRRAMVTAGGDTDSQCASVAEMTVSPSLSAARIALR